MNRDFIDALKTKIVKDSTTSIRKIAAEIKMKTKTVRTAVHDDLGLKVYTRTPRHLFTEYMKVSWEDARKYSDTSRIMGPL